MKSPHATRSCGGDHSGFVTKFIRAEVVHYEDFIAAQGSFAKAKEAGQQHLVHDGDIMNIRDS